MFRSCSKIKDESKSYLIFFSSFYEYYWSFYDGKGLTLFCDATIANYPLSSKTTSTTISLRTHDFELQQRGRREKTAISWGLCVNPHPPPPANTDITTTCLSPLLVFLLCVCRSAALCWGWSIAKLVSFFLPFIFRINLQFSSIFVDFFRKCVLL